MNAPLARPGDAHRAAILSLGSKGRPAAKAERLSMDSATAKAVDDAIIALLPLGTKTTHSPAPLPQPDMPVRVGFERHGMEIAVMEADAALMSALVAHQCGIIFRTTNSRPGRFETGFLSGLAMRLLPALFGTPSEVQVAKAPDGAFSGDRTCADTQFLVTVPHKPDPIIGRLRVIAPVGSAVSTVTGDSRASDPALQTTLVSARCHLPVRRMSLQQVAGLREGSVLTLERGTDAVLTIKGKTFTHGTLHETAGQRSFRTREHSHGDRS